MEKILNFFGKISTFWKNIKFFGKKLDKSENKFEEIRKKGDYFPKKGPRDTTYETFNIKQPTMLIFKTLLQVHSCSVHLFGTFFILVALSLSSLRYYDACVTLTQEEVTQQSRNKHNAE